MSSLSSGISTGNGTITISPTTTTTSGTIYVSGTGTSSGTGIVATGSSGGLTGGGSGWYSPIGSGTGIITYPNMMSNRLAYYLFKLPIKRIPHMVFINGEACTIGIFGSDAECVIGMGHLVLNYTLFSTALFRPKTTIILEYKTKTYHYAVGEDNSGHVKVKEGTNVLDVDLLSVIKK